jgi:hypothetical protein
MWRTPTSPRPLVGLRAAIAVLALSGVVLSACRNGDDAIQSTPTSTAGTDSTIGIGPTDTTVDSISPTTALTTEHTTETTTGSPAELVGGDLAGVDVAEQIELSSGDFGMVVGDGRRLWAMSDSGVVARIDPLTGEVTELRLDDASGGLLPTLGEGEIWVAALDGSSVIRIDSASMVPDPPIEVGASGLVILDPDGHGWVQRPGPPAELAPFDRTTGAIGEPLQIDTAGEVVGATIAFGRFWVPLFDEAELVVLDLAGGETGRIPIGAGPVFAREASGAVWVTNRIDATVQRIDPGTLEVITVDLGVDGEFVDQPSGIQASGDAVWVRAGLSDGPAIVFRIDADTGEIVGRRTLPMTIAASGGMAVVDDRLWVLDRLQRTMLGIDTAQFLVPGERPYVDDAGPSEDEVAIEEAVRALLSTSATPADMAAGIGNGERLGDQIAAFKRFFEENLPGEEYEGDVVGIRVDGDRAEIEFVVNVADRPIVESIGGVVVRDGTTWLLTAPSFCRLIATGEIDCPADLTDDT